MRNSSSSGAVFRNASKSASVCDSNFPVTPMALRREARLLFVMASHGTTKRIKSDHIAVDIMAQTSPKNVVFYKFAKSSRLGQYRLLAPSIGQIWTLGKVLRVKGSKSRPGDLRGALLNDIQESPTSTPQARSAIGRPGRRWIYPRRFSEHPGLTRQSWQWPSRPRR